MGCGLNTPSKNQTPIAPAGDSSDGGSGAAAALKSGSAGGGGGGGGLLGGLVAYGSDDSAPSCDVRGQRT